MSERRVLSREQVREVDRRAVEDLGIPGVVLMENAAINAAALVRDYLGRQGGEGETPPSARSGPADNQTTAGAGPPAIAIVCGGGNNGGDGYAIARHLHNHGHRVELFAAKDPAGLKGDAATNHAICANMGLPITRVDDESELDGATERWAKADLLIDAMLGTGFTGEVREPLATIIERINGRPGPRLIAIDTPSGLDCQTGRPATRTIRADVTITFVAEKTGFTVPGAGQYAGEVYVADIGVSPALVDAVGG